MMLSRNTRSREFFKKLVVQGVKHTSQTLKDTYLTNFYHADLELRNISNELDSFDGKKDPIRCNLLVNQLRTAQDKVISIIFQLMDECRCQRASRDYRMKFPDEILLTEGSESLNGQIWFGAECLSAGSNILNHVKESTLLRPMAKKLTSNLDQLRRELRELVANGGDGTWITEDLLMLMGEFDKVFAAFEYDYVRTMLPIRTVSEIERLQEVAVLFSETLMSSLAKGLLKQEEIEEYQPIVMIAIPRLAIVKGLLCPNDNPIYSKHKSHMCSLFQPFHGPLHAIRGILKNLEPFEILTLEKMLANDQGASLLNEQKGYICDKININDKDDCGIEMQQEVNYNRILTDNLQYPVGSKCFSASDDQATFCANNLNPPATSASIENSEPTSSLRVNVDRSTVDFSSPPNLSNLSSNSYSGETDSRLQDCSFINCDYDSQLQRLIAEFNPQINEPSHTEVPELKNKNDPKVEKTIAQSPDVSSQVEQSAIIQQLFVKQAQELLHRMFVAIAGVADQLQSNFASDLRFILRNIFVTDSDQEDSDIESSASSATIEEGIEAEEIEHLLELSQSNIRDIMQDSNLVLNDRAILQTTSSNQTDSSNLVSMSRTRRRSCNCENEAELNNTNQAVVSPQHVPTRTNLPTLGQHSRLCRCRICLSNLDNSSDHQSHHTSYRSTSSRRRTRDHSDSRSRNSTSISARRVQQAPVWVPDELVVACGNCNAGFTLIRRRHHCRACGHIFCGECSKYRKMLHFWGSNKPERVCESCYNRP